MSPASVTDSPDPVSLVERVSMLAFQADSMPLAVLAAEVDGARLAAIACGHFQGAAILQAISAALERGERSALIGAWLDVLRSAVLPGRFDLRSHDSHISSSAFQRIG